MRPIGPIEPIEPTRPLLDLHGASVIGEGGEKADSSHPTRINKVMVGNNKWKKKIKQQGLEMAGGHL